MAIELEKVQNSELQHHDKLYRPSVRCRCTSVSASNHNLQTKSENRTHTAKTITHTAQTHRKRPMTQSLQINRVDGCRRMCVTGMLRRVLQAKPLL